MLPKPLPATLVARLTRIMERQQERTPLLPKTHNRIYRFLGRLRILDHRAHLRTTPAQDTKNWGRRVRAFDVSRNFPGIPVALKRTHGDRMSFWLFHIKRPHTSAELILYKLSQKILRHNQKYAETDYELHPPVAASIGHDIIAMPKVNYPSIEEILGINRPKEASRWIDKTRRGTSFFNRIQRKNPNVSREQLANAAQLLYKRTRFDYSNVWLAGYRNNHFVFLSKPDPY